jgi:hypothetical protein
MAYSNDQGQSSNDAANPLKSLPAASIVDLRPQRPAISRNLQCLCDCCVHQRPSCNMHPYGGRAGVPPPAGSGLLPRGFGVASKADFKDRRSSSRLRRDYLIGPYDRGCFGA